MLAMTKSTERAINAQPWEPLSGMLLVRLVRCQRGTLPGLCDQTRPTVRAACRIFGAIAKCMAALSMSQLDAAVPASGESQPIS